MDRIPLLTPYQTATLLAVTLARSQQRRAKVSRTTIKQVSGRKRLRVNSFVQDVLNALDEEYGWHFIPMDDGGYFAIARSAMSAKPVTPKGYLTKDERRKIRRRELTEEDWDEFYDEVSPESDDDMEFDDD